MQPRRAVLGLLLLCYVCVAAARVGPAVSLPTETSAKAVGIEIEAKEPLPATVSIAAASVPAITASTTSAAPGVAAAAAETAAAAADDDGAENSTEGGGITPAWGIGKRKPKYTVKQYGTPLPGDIEGAPAEAPTSGKLPGGGSTTEGKSQKQQQGSDAAANPTKAPAFPVRQEEDNSKGTKAGADGDDAAEPEGETSDDSLAKLLSDADAEGDEGEGEAPAAAADPAAASGPEGQPAEQVSPVSDAVQKKKGHRKTKGKGSKHTHEDSADKKEGEADKAEVKEDQAKPETDADKAPSKAEGEEEEEEEEEKEPHTKAHTHAHTHKKGDGHHGKGYKKEGSGDDDTSDHADGDADSSSEAEDGGEEDSDEGEKDHTHGKHAGKKHQKVSEGEEAEPDDKQEKPATHQKHHHKGDKKKKHASHKHDDSADQAADTQGDDSTPDRADDAGEGSSDSSSHDGEEGEHNKEGKGHHGRGKKGHGTKKHKGSKHHRGEEVEEIKKPATIHPRFPQPPVDEEVVEDSGEEGEAATDSADSDSDSDSHKGKRGKHGKKGAHSHDGGDGSGHHHAHHHHEKQQQSGDAAADSTTEAHLQQQQPGPASNSDSSSSSGDYSKTGEGAHDSGSSSNAGGGEGDADAGEGEGKEGRKEGKAAHKEKLRKRHAAHKAHKRGKLDAEAQGLGAFGVEDQPVPQPPGEILNTFVASGSFNWRALAADASASASTAGLGEAPYFPTLRGPKRRGSGSANAGAGVDNAAFALGVNNATLDTSKGFWGASDSDPDTLPTDEALLVGPAEGGAGADKNRRYVVHAANRVAEIFLANSDGSVVVNGLGVSRISLQSLIRVTQVVGAASLVASEPTGYYDIASRRYVLMWLGTAPAQDVEPLLFVAVSAGSDPMGQWEVKALKLKPSAATFKCSAGASSGGRAKEQPFFVNYPQVTYSGEGVFASVGLVCTSKSNSQAALAESFRSAIYAFSKASMYASSSSSNVTLNAAVYIVAKSWYRSLSVSSSVVIGDYLNNFAQPARPQTLEDVYNGPYWVQKVDDAYISIATITGGSFANLASVQTAPRISAGMFARGHNFHNGGEYEGLNALSQPETDVQLFAGDTGLVGRTFAVRSYGAVLYQGSVYLTTSEFYGSGSHRVPSIYWAIIEPNSLATGAINVQGSGVVASKDGLALGFPVIAALASGDGAVIAYTYSRHGEVAGMGHAYPGVATTTIRNYGRTGQASIDLVKRGEGSITIPAVHDMQRYGDYSAATVIDNKIWFAVPTTKLAGGHHDPLVDACYGSWISTRALE